MPGDCRICGPLGVVGSSVATAIFVWFRGLGGTLLPCTSGAMQSLRPQGNLQVSLRWHPKPPGLRHLMLVELCGWSCVLSSLGCRRCVLAPAYTVLGICSTRPLSCWNKHWSLASANPPISTSLKDSCSISASSTFSILGTERSSQDDALCPGDTPTWSQCLVFQFMTALTSMQTTKYALPRLLSRHLRRSKYPDYARRPQTDEISRLIMACRPMSTVTLVSNTDGCSSHLRDVARGCIGSSSGSCLCAACCTAATPLL